MKIKKNNVPKEEQTNVTEFAQQRIDLEGRLKRALADYDNLLKRTAKERQEVIIRATKSLVEDLLPIVDNLDRAQIHLKDPGLQMALDQMQGVLAEYGLEEITVAPGDMFNTLYNEAIDATEGGEAGTIAQILAKGYKWRDGVVLRPAKVVVYKSKQSS